MHGKIAIYSDYFVGETQNSTEQCDTKLDQMNEWIQEYEVKARLILEDKTQLLK